MKKIFLFFTLIGVTLGLVFGIRSAIKNRKNNEVIVELDSGDNYIHELNIPIMEIDSLNPLLTTNKHVSNILQLIYEPLVLISYDETLTPILGIEWAKKDDLNWIVKLRKGVKWHNGTEFTSKDVIFTVNSLLSENVNSLYKSNLLNVLNVEALDEYSVIFTLQEKDDFFIYKLVFPIVPEYYFKNGDILNENKNNIPVGTGAYKYVTTNDIEDYIQIEKNSNWWNHELETKLNTIYLMRYPTYGEAIKSYKSAKVDMIITSMTDWVKKFGTIGNNVYSFESSTFDTIVPNTKRASLAESSVRKALLFAINRENIVSKVFDGNATVTDMPIHNRSKYYFSGLQSEYDLDKAKQVLINAGWKNDGTSWQKNGQRLRFTLLVNEENSEQVRSAEIIKENLSEINIDITIKKISFINLQKALNTDDFDLVLASFDIKNELTILELIQSDSVLNYANFTNQKVDEAVQEVHNNYNEATMQALERGYKDEVPYIGLYFRNSTLLTNKSVKGSIEPRWNYPFANMTTWCK
ncbi:MAG: hypothetical protein IJ220_04175 [Clostridia bacterium]|nr:hypothetical protein [Clostridia bacterium]